MQRSQTLALAFLFLAGTVAHADPISWSYAWSSSPGVVTSNDGSLGSVTLLPGSGGPLTGSHDSGPGITAATLTAVAPASGTAFFTNRGYTLTMHLMDNGLHASTDLSFAGAFGGTLGATNSLTNSFKAPTQSVNLGGNQYIVTVGLFVPPLPGTPGRIGANVTVSGSGVVTPPVTQAPEPATLLLGLVGGSALGLRCWWRKRRPAAGGSEPA
jgi:hypothetical protein